VETVIIEKKVVLATGPDFILNEDEVRRLNLSKRELEVLQLMAGGLSNQEIAERLFVSLNTIKTHSAQIFEKMEVKRRTQAVDMAKRLSIIP
jgi:ATP/maltotriose-dependent transcriptional regulator MalT